MTSDGVTLGPNGDYSTQGLTNPLNQTNIVPAAPTDEIYYSIEYDSALNINNSGPFFLYSTTLTGLAGNPTWDGTTAAGRRVISALSYAEGTYGSNPPIASNIVSQTLFFQEPAPSASCYYASNAGLSANQSFEFILNGGTANGAVQVGDIAVMRLTDLSSRVGDLKYGYDEGLTQTYDEQNLIVLDPSQSGNPLLTVFWEKAPTEGFAESVHNSASFHFKVGKPPTVSLNGNTYDPSIGTIWGDVYVYNGVTVEFIPYSGACVGYTLTNQNLGTSDGILYDGNPFFLEASADLQYVSACSRRSYYDASDTIIVGPIHFQCSTPHFEVNQSSQTIVLTCDTSNATLSYDFGSGWAGTSNGQNLAVPSDRSIIGLSASKDYYGTSALDVRVRPDPVSIVAGISYSQGSSSPYDVVYLVGGTGASIYYATGPTTDGLYVDFNSVTYSSAITVDSIGYIMTFQNEPGLLVSPTITQRLPFHYTPNKPEIYVEGSGDLSGGSTTLYNDPVSIRFGLGGGTLPGVSIYYNLSGADPAGAFGILYVDSIPLYSVSGTCLTINARETDGLGDWSSLAYANVLFKCSTPYIQIDRQAQAVILSCDTANVDLLYDLGGGTISASSGQTIYLSEVESVFASIVAERDHFQSAVAQNITARTPGVPNLSTYGNNTFSLTGSSSGSSVYYATGTSTDSLTIGINSSLSDGNSISYGTSIYVMTAQELPGMLLGSATISYLSYSPLGVAMPEFSFNAGSNEMTITCGTSNTTINFRGGSNGLDWSSWDVYTTTFSIFSYLNNGTTLYMEAYATDNINQQSATATFSSPIT
jgi:hypothetical protein